MNRLYYDAFACWWRPCGVTWDAVAEQSWILQLRRTTRHYSFPKACHQSYIYICK